MFENILRLCHFPIKSRSLVTQAIHLSLSEKNWKEKNKGKIPANYYLCVLYDELQRKKRQRQPFFRLLSLSLLFSHLHGPWVANARRRCAVWFNLNIIAFYTSNKDLLDVSVMCVCVRAACILLSFYGFHNKSRSNGESISIYMLCVSYIFIHRFIIWQYKQHTSRPSQFHCTRSIYLL